jgi:hypothetical protein
VTLVVSTAGNSTATRIKRPDGFYWLVGVVWGIACLVFVLIRRPASAAVRVMAATGLACVILAIVGCGGGGSSSSGLGNGAGNGGGNGGGSQGTPVGAYDVTVTATGGGFTAAADFTLNVS